MRSKSVRRVRPAFFLAGIVALALAAPVSAQDTLAEGTWTGSVFPPGEGPADVEFSVTYGDDGLEIILVPPADLGVGEMQAYEVMHEGDVLTFTLEVGVSVGCVLYRADDGSFEGDCTDPSGEAASMTMVPPEPRGSA